MRPTPSPWDGEGKFKVLLTSGKATLVDEASNPLKKVEFPDDYDSGDEVASVDNDMACSMASERLVQGIVHQCLQQDISHGEQRFLRYIDTRPNGDALRKCILKGPYTPTIVTTPAVPATEDSPSLLSKQHTRQLKKMWKPSKAQQRNNLTVATMQVNVQFLQQLQPEWSRFVTIVKQQHKLDEVSYHKLFDILKQYQKEVNELRAERMAKNANPLALIHGKDPEVPIMQTQGTDAETLGTVETGDSNVIPDSPDMCDNDIQDDQNDVECDDERVALANLIANLKLDVDENKKIQKQLKKANASLTQELKECKSTLAETSRTLGESNSIRDSCLVALQNKQTEFERYKAFNDRTVDYDKLERKLNETLGLLAQKDIDIKEGLKVKAYEISVVKEKHDELVKQSLLTKSHYEGLVKEKTKVITDLKLKEEKDIDKMISMENQLKFLNEIVYKRSQSIQTIHMLAPKCPTFNGRPTFANPMYLKKAQNEIPCSYEISHDQSDPANNSSLIGKRL
ncbi:hypothetical protein Tco_0285951 [Tanacetum coccineum]